MPSVRSCANAPSSAKLFIQMSLRSRACSAALPTLDILYPRTSFGARRWPNPTSAPRFLSTLDASRLRSKVLTTPERRMPAVRRHFSNTTSRPATHAILNPQQDEDGNEMKLEITSRAAKRLSEIMTKDTNPNLALRIQVESGGCHGFQYLMSLVTLPSTLPESTAPTENSQEGVVREDDTIFTYVSDGAVPAEGTATPKIILDGPSLELLKGSRVDFTMELIGSQFKIVDNPLATSSCGCGTSFDIKL